MLDGRQYGGDHQIPDGPHHQQRDHLLGAVVDHLDRVEQFRHRQHVNHRRPFGEADDFVKPGRQDGAQRLRENYAHGATPRRQTQRSGRLILTVVDPKEAPANDLRRIGALHQRQPHDGGRKLPENVDGFKAAPGNAGKRHAERERVVEIGEVIEDNQYHDQRQRSEQPDVTPRQAVQQP